MASKAAGAVENLSARRHRGEPDDSLGLGTRTLLAEGWRVQEHVALIEELVPAAFHLWQAGHCDG